MLDFWGISFGCFLLSTTNQLQEKTLTLTQGASKSKAVVVQRREKRTAGTGKGLQKEKQGKTWKNTNHQFLGVPAVHFGVSNNLFQNPSEKQSPETNNSEFTPKN